MLLFSDLHLSPKTFATCMKVLRRVHAEALQRQVPVGFLGDFFDRVYNEGTLPVDILNTLLRFFEREWQVPMVMIPGNHDYFDASETEHGLTPFQYACKHITILDHPTMIDDALWIPWRRDHVQLKRVIDEHPECRVIFGHFDIIGFKLNATRVSTEGLAPSMFPDDVPVYTGHYHTPQVHNNICYLGSPYQLSLSEAEDKKSLLVLDAHWHVCDKIPLDVGRKQYKWTPNELLARAKCLKLNDRVSVTCSLTNDTIVQLVASLRDRGVDIQVRRPDSTIHTRVCKQDQMSSSELLNAYASLNAIDVESSAWKQVMSWLKKNPAKQKNLIANTVTPIRMDISGFGPFAGPITIAMDNNGLTLVSGECNAAHIESNGAGKSMVTAGAWLWACTGLIDGRGALMFDGDTSIIHKGAEKAEVVVSGTVDGVPWKIMRSLQDKKHNIRLFLNHEERTRSTLSGTQRAIATELFGLDLKGSQLHQWLLRNSVWSQQSVARWLDANDTQAKAELHSLANMDVWTSLFSWAKLLAKDTKEDLVAAVVALNSSTLAAKAANERHAENTRRATEWQANHARRLIASTAEILKLQSTYDKTELPVEALSSEEPALQETKLKVEDLRTCIAKMSAHVEHLNSQVPEEWRSKDLKQEELALRGVTPPNVEQANTTREQCLAEKKARNIQFGIKKKEFETFKSKGECFTCKRAFDKGTDYHEHLRTLKDQLEVVRLKYTDANSAYVDAQQKAIHANSDLLLYTKRVRLIQSTRALMRAEDRLEKTKNEFDTIRSRYETMTDRVADMKRQKMLYDQTKNLRSELFRTLEVLERRHTELEGRECPYSTSDTDKQNTEEARLKADRLVEQIRKRVDEHTAIMKWSGPRGIQTYAMEHTVQRLAQLTTIWLQRFFKTDQIELRASFDKKERLRRVVWSPKHAGIMSGGQWRRAQLASFMAWREMSGVIFPLLVMDEACTSMDAAGIRSVQETLREWCEEDSGRTCFFITHEPEQHRDTSVYQNHMKILHKRGRSSIADESSLKRFKK